MPSLISFTGTHQNKFLLDSNRTNSWWIAHMYFLTCFPPWYVVSKKGLSTIRYFFNQHLFSNVFIMTLNYFLYPILVQNPENSHLEDIHIFPIHQHTATINRTIQQHYCYITSTHKTFKDGPIWGVVRLFWGRLWIWFKAYSFSYS